MNEAKPKVKAEIAVVVTRADGTVQDYGVVAKSGWWWRLRHRWAARRRIEELNRAAQAGKGE